MPESNTVLKRDRGRKGGEREIGKGDVFLPTIHNPSLKKIKERKHEENPILSLNSSENVKLIQNKESGQNFHSQEEPQRYGNKCNVESWMGS